MAALSDLQNKQSEESVLLSPMQSALGCWESMVGKMCPRHGYYSPDLKIAFRLHTQTWQGQSFLNPLHVLMCCRILLTSRSENTLCDMLYAILKIIIMPEVNLNHACS